MTPHPDAFPEPENWANSDTDHVLAAICQNLAVLANEAKRIADQLEDQANRRRA